MIGRFPGGFTIALAAAILTGCGGAQPPIGAPFAISQSRASNGYNSLYSFGTTSLGTVFDGQEPKAGLIDVNGTLYGTTSAGGTYDDGTVFSMSTTGAEKVLYSFQGTGTKDGANPSASLLAVNGLLYGTTEYGGYSFGAQCNAGTVFRISALGAEKVLYRFYGYYCYSHVYNDGANPVASLIDVKGKLYGTTVTGGFNELWGTVFRVSTSGREKVLYSFEGYGLSDGANPTASLLNVKGTLYGTTEYGGEGLSSVGYGTAFTISTTGTEHVLQKFAPGPDGDYPEAGLINVNGTLYGTAAGGGAYGSGFGDGTAFSITTSGHVTALHSFGSGSDGINPWAPLLDVRGTLYGTTSAGGAYGKGTVFKMSLSGKEKVLHSFGYGADGATPLAGLVNVHGTLYGTTSAGGTYGKGTVFSLKP
ncbi:MAG: choice-of-anchor tandem repeat GloVer-containing protein [Candidatus Cybelea sp.]|jgi:uncharacterized repeat protein (TIGR03803 family)